MDALHFRKISMATLVLVCFWASNPLPAEADKLVWQTGRVTDVEELDAGRSSRFDPSCASLRARIYTVETGSQILKMLGNMGPAVLPDERSSIRFAVDGKSRAHLFDANGREQRLTLIVYESVWKDRAKARPAVPTKQKSSTGGKPR